MRDIPLIRTEEVRCCALCGDPGTLLYHNLHDRLFNVPGSWSFLRCGHCALIWLSPRPIVEDLVKTYKQYMTHYGDGTRGRMEVFQERIADRILSSVDTYGYVEDDVGGLSGKLLGWIPLFRDIAQRQVLNIYGTNRGNLLDVGCGDGKYLARMRDLGWKVVGVEPDPTAAKKARDQYGLSVFSGTLADADFPSENFDAISLKHVVEHVADPVALIRDCHRVLKAGGSISLATPNTASLQHKLFKSAWLELDPPRHLHLFAVESLTAILEASVPGGFHVIKMKSVSLNTGQISVMSRTIRNQGRWNTAQLSNRQIIEAMAFLAAEELIKWFRPYVGEEILLTATKRKSPNS